MRNDTIPATPLAALATVLCHKDTVPFFPNQVVMYQFLITICGGNISFLNDRILNIDDLIREISVFVQNSGKNNTTKLADESLPEHISDLHQCIYENIANTDTKLSFNPWVGNTHLLSVKSLNDAHNGGTGNIESNISNIISGKGNRKIPKFWSKLIAKDSENEYSRILQRIFWILQYYIAYYMPESELFRKNDVVPTAADNLFPEYYCLSDMGRKSLYKWLREYCGTYSKLINNLLEHTFDLSILSKIILDTIIAMVNWSQKVKFKRITDIIQVAGDIQVLTELDQYRFFQKSIDCYGADSFDHYKALIRYAETNCYAAERVGLMYYWGKKFYISKTNVYEIVPDREKAIQYFQQAVKLSNPPIQSACWSLAYTIEYIGYDTEKEAEHARLPADKFYQKCGDYPPALASRALRLQSIAESEYNKKTISYLKYVEKIAGALNLFHQSGDAGWVFGYNNIAIFLFSHNDEQLFNDLRDKVNFELHDVWYYLETSADMGNLWAMKKLAERYLKTGDYEKSKEWLTKGIEYGYAKAYYLMALHFSKDDKEQRKLLQIAAEQGEPIAAFDLGNIYLNVSDYRNAKKWYQTCLRLIQTAKETDTSLYQEVKEKLDSLQNKIEPTP